jgi:peptide/nickel transport system substrate-binding protein
MKRFAWAFPALASALIVTFSPALGARPRYGGTLRVETAGTIGVIDRAAGIPDVQADAVRAAILPLAFEGLTGIDATGSLRPLLAVSWQSDAQSKRWQFRLRGGVKFHDGVLLTSAHVAGALREVEPAWKITELPEGVTIECDRGTPGLAWQLAAPGYAVAVAGAGATPLGTGPFKIESFEPNRRITFVAHDAHWAARPFLDRVILEMGRASRDQATSLELGRAEMVSLLPQDARRLSQRGVRVSQARSRELAALVFGRGAAFAGNDQARAAVAASIDRASICSVLLQREADPAWSLLPNWLSGYASLFPVRYDRAAAKAAVAALPAQLRTPTLTYHATDPLAQSMAERIAVDLREAGMLSKLEPVRGSAPPPRADMRLVRVAFDAGSASRALAQLLSFAELENPAGADAVAGPTEDTYRVEQTTLDRNLLVPLVHLPVLYALSPRVQVPAGLLVTPSGALNLAEAWLSPALVEGEKR